MVNPSFKYDENDIALDALKEHLGIGVGKAAATLNQILNKHINLNVPTITIIGRDSLEQLKEQAGNELLSSVTMQFEGSLKGNASVFFDKGSAISLVEMLIPEAVTSGPEIASINESTITEVGNIIINSVLGSLSNCFDYDLNYQVPEYKESDLSELFARNLSGEESVILFGETFLVVEEKQIKGKIVLFFLVRDLESLLNSWRGKSFE